MYVTFNQKIYVYWEVQLERMESTNLLKLLEAEPEYRRLLQELGMGESQQAAGLENRGLRRATASYQPLSCPQILMTSQQPAPWFTKPSTTLSSHHSVLLQASRIPPSWTFPLN